METHFPDKSLHAHQKSHVTLRQETEIDLTSSGLITFTASKCCYGHSQKPEESLSSKYFCIIVLHNGVLKQQASTSECSDSIYCYVWSLWGANNLYHIWKLLYSVASPIFLVIFSATVYQEMTILFSLTHWMETYSYVFYAIFQFCA